MDQTVRLKSITVTTMTVRLAARSSKSGLDAAILIVDPKPRVMSVSPLKATYSATMLAFHAPPAAVTQPVTRVGKTQGR